MTARAQRHLVARALHEPLRRTLAASEGALPRAASRAIERLLPGNPKPVAALTRNPDVLRHLLHDGERGDLDALAADALFALALAGALDEALTLALPGPRVLTHRESGRRLALVAGETLTLREGALHVEGRRLDAWHARLTEGEEWSERAGLRVRAALDAAMGDRLDAALGALDAAGFATAGVPETLVVLEGEGGAADDVSALPALPPLPGALFAGRVPRDATSDAPGLATALLRECALHRVQAARVVDPLVDRERDLEALVARVDAWARRRLGVSPGASTPPVGEPPPLTPLGRALWDELGG